MIHNDCVHDSNLLSTASSCFGLELSIALGLKIIWFLREIVWISCDIIKSAMFGFIFLAFCSNLRIGLVRCIFRDFFIHFSPPSHRRCLPAGIAHSEVLQLLFLVLASSFFHDSVCTAWLDFESRCLLLSPSLPMHLRDEHSHNRILVDQYIRLHCTQHHRNCRWQ